MEAASGDVGALERAVRTGQVPAPLRGAFIATVVAARGLARGAFGPKNALSDADVAKLRDRSIKLIEAMCGQSPVLGALAEQPSAPAWLDVASPAHGQVNVGGIRRWYRTGHVEATDSTAMVAANNCTLDTVDHYEVRRVSLDCSSLYGDPRIMETFTMVLLDPSPRTVQTFQSRLASLVGPAPEAGRQLYRERVSTGVTTTADGSGVAILGDGSAAQVTTSYHVRETVVHLANLLHEHPDLITELATSFQPGTVADQPGAMSGLDQLAAIMEQIGRLDDAALLRNAVGLDSGDATVRQRWGTTRADLASTVMVGYGNALTRSTSIDVGSTVHRDLDVFDAAITRIHARVVTSGASDQLS